MSGDTDRMELRSLAVAGARWSVIDKWGVRLLNLATFAVLGYLLEPAEFGVVAAAQVAVAMAMTFAEQGLAQAVIVDDQDDDETRSTAFWIALGSGLLIALVMAALAPLIAMALGIPEIVPVLRALSLVLVLRALGSVPDALAQRRLQFKALAVRSVTAAAVGAAIGIGCAIAGAGVWALVAQVLSQVAVSTLLLWVATRFRPRFRFSMTTARRMWRFGWKVVAIDLFTVTAGQGDNLVVGAVLGPVALGYYVIARRLLNVVVDAFTGVMSALSLPVFARLKNDRPGLIAALRQATRTSLAVSVPVFGSLAIVAPFLVPLLFGPQWHDSAKMLQVLCVTGVVSSLAYFDRGVLLAAGRPGLEIAAIATLAVVTVAAAALGAQASVFAVAVAIAARSLLMVPLRLSILRIALRLDLWAYLRGWLAPLLGGMGLLASAAGIWLVMPAQSGWLALSIAAAVGLAAYAAVLWLLDRPLVHTLVGFLRRA
ncbi:lipopolysaccharide biosynthesis protein [Blastococcus colisei]|uniref:lipopolysaccharide biosynthesis protein n=1 Tax=Blastococcus colisei TaxID=1564162 RepID=UPI0011533A91|nr:lipopolysaccharide biosynthesis protein [Blastococcus colisei]